MVAEVRLIDADALIANEDLHIIIGAGDNICIDIADIAKAPAVDALEVVRCNDCKYWHKDTGWCDKHSHFITSDGEACHPWESSSWKDFDDNDFCSYGERKADNAAD